MADLSTSFWNYAKSISGVNTLDDVFVKWASAQNLPVNDLQSTWKKINNEVFESFGLKKSTVSISGDPEDVAKAVQQLQHATNVPTSIPPLTKPATVPTVPPTKPEDLAGGVETGEGVKKTLTDLIAE